MRRRWLFGTVTASVCALLAATAGLQGAKPLSDIPLEVKVLDQATGIKSDGDWYTSGSYNVLAVLLANDFGNFIFDTNDKNGMDGGRRLRLNFDNQPNLPESLPVKNDWFSADVFLGTIGVTQKVANDGNLRAMNAGENLKRRARLGWEEGGVQYSLRWDGIDEDGFLNFHCDTDYMGCTQWTVTSVPADTTTSTGKAGLYTVDIYKGTAHDTRYGSYTMLFSMTLRKH